jgi:hypothetical protein
VAAFFVGGSLEAAMSSWMLVMAVTKEMRAAVPRRRIWGTRQLCVVGGTLLAVVRMRRMLEELKADLPGEVTAVPEETRARPADSMSNLGVGLALGVELVMVVVVLATSWVSLVLGRSVKRQWSRHCHLSMA